MGTQSRNRKVKKKSVFREYAEAAVIAVILALFIRAFVIQAFKIPSSSMEPTLLIGDHILVNKFIYGVKLPFFRHTLIPLGDPKRNDVIVFIYPHDTSKDFIKRVIGVPGDRIEIVGKKIHINSQPFDDVFGVYTKTASHYRRQTKPASGPIIVPENHLFVMGDNRDHSSDSRVWGFVPLKSVKGKAFIIYWSWPNWKRFLHLVK